MLREDVATSPQVLRRMNVGAVLRFALESQTFLASDVMEATGLTRSTVLGLCDTLVEQGWIGQAADSREAGQYSKGRPARRYRLREEAGYIVGVDAGLHTFTAAVSRLRGGILARTSLPVGGEDGEIRRTTARAAVDSVLAEAGISPQEVFLVVVGVPAPVDGQGVSPAGHEFWSHMNPGFQEVFEDCGITVVDNDANLAALAEQAHAPEVSSFATLLSGERFGAGLIVDGKLLRGRHGGAGELRLLDIVKGVGSSEGLGFLARKWAVAASRSKALPPGSALAKVPRAQLSAEAVFGAAAGGDAAAQGIVDRLGERLARVTQVLASLLDVEQVIVAGAIANAAQPVIDKAAAVLDEVFYPPVPNLVASKLGADGVMLGALECGLSMLRARPLQFTPFRAGITP